MKDILERIEQEIKRAIEATDDETTNVGDRIEDALAILEDVLYLIEQERKAQG